ncbi:MAG: NTP transferase domain-containing protein [Chloroflexota bacterium]|nr:NTP transferase domain-containing protein [Chloroflexota bacterium]
MTVAAVILFHSPEGPLADANGRPAARRIVESAWAGGATPIVVVAFDPTGAVAASLAGSPAILAEPAPVEAGPVAQIARGIDVAAGLVTETDAAFIWPGRMVLADAETVTTLIEAHGARRESILRPSYGDEDGWPTLVPMSVLPLLRAQAANLMPDEILAATVAAGAKLESIDMGDPGVNHDIATSFDQLPAYDGPAEPGAGMPPEWGAAAADMRDDAPLEGPALAPYAQASEEGD